MNQDEQTGALAPSSSGAHAGAQLIPADALEPKDPTAFPRDDPVQQERWSVTLDGVSKEEAQALARRLIGEEIACHLQVVGPHVTVLGFTYLGVSGLMEVCVRREDLLRATDIAESQFPERWQGERLAHGRLWTPSAIGETVSVLCRLPWADCWDLAAQLHRHGIPSIVLFDDVTDPSPKEEMSLVESMGDEAENSADRWSRLGMGGRIPDEAAPIEERHAYCVAVEEPRLKEATDFAGAYIGDRFVLDGTPYDG